MVVTIDKVVGSVIYYTSEVKKESWTGKLLKVK
jgi:hypothetical protein